MCTHLDAVDVPQQTRRLVGVDAVPRDERLQPHELVDRVRPLLAAIPVRELSVARFEHRQGHLEQLLVALDLLLHLAAKAGIKLHVRAHLLSHKAFGCQSLATLDPPAG